MISLTRDYRPAAPDNATIHHATIIRPFRKMRQSAMRQKCLLAETEMSSSQDRHVFQPKQKCLLAKTEMSSSQDRNVF